MKFAMVTDGSLMEAGGIGYPDRYNQLVREAIAAEEAGFHLWGASETHFAPGQINALSSPDALLGAVAAQTERIRLRYMAVPLPVHQPLFVAERVAALDALSRGRIELGTARGNSPTLFSAVGIEPGDTRARWEESLQIVSGLLAGKPVSYKGQFWEYEVPQIYPLPVQTPVPLSAVATGIDSHVATGKLGLRCLSWDGYLGWEYVAQCRAAYDEGLASASPVNGKVNKGFTAYTSATCCKTDRDRAIDSVEPRALNFLDMIATGYERLAQKKGYEYYDYVRTVLENRKNVRGLMEHSPSVIAGDPDDLVAFCRRLEGLGCDEIVFSIDGLSGDGQRETIELIGKYVIPEFDEA